MTTSQRTKSVVERLLDTALADSLRGPIERMLAAGEDFKQKALEIRTRVTLTEQGKREALLQAFPEHMGALVRAREPVVKARDDLAARRAAFPKKSVDRTDLVGALERQELRTWLRGIDANARSSVAMTTGDERILFAIVSAPAALSGFVGNIADVYRDVEKRHLELVNGPELKAIAEDEAIIEVADAADQIARNDMQFTLEMSDHDFNRLAGPIERKAGAPWLIKTAGGVVRIRWDKRGTPDFQKLATEQELAAGYYWKNESEYLAAQERG